ncbi:MAG: nucleoside recognition domain-containing protein [Clostridia bacterium]
MQKQNYKKCHNCIKYVTGETKCGPACNPEPVTPFVPKGIDLILLHRVWGKVIFFAFLLFMLFVMGKLIASDLTDFISIHFFDQFLLPLCRSFLNNFVASGSLLSNLFVGPYGALSMGLVYLIGIIAPIVAGFYFFMTFIEKAGYLERIALLSDRSLHRIGLSGKMTIPLILGFGCATMAFVSTSCLPTRKERIIASTLIALTIPCSAQFGIITGELASLGPQYIAIYALVLIAIFIATSIVLNYVLPGEARPMNITVPPMRVPKLSELLRITGAKTWEFVKEAFPVFLIAGIVLTFLDNFGGLKMIFDLMAPITEGLLKLPADTSMAFILGLIRRELGVVQLLTLHLTAAQMLIALVTMTLFFPCLSAMFVLYKERGKLEATIIVLCCFVSAFLVGGVLAHFLLPLLAPIL